GPQALQHDGAAQTGHAQIEHHHVGLELARQLHRGDAVVGLPDDLDARIALQRTNHALANERMVLRDQHADLHAATSWVVPVVRVTNVPFPGSLATDAWPPVLAMRSMMLWRRPMPATAWARSMPMPSSLTTMRAPVSDVSHRTTTQVAFACLWTLLSASRTAPTSAAASAPYTLPLRSVI